MSQRWKDTERALAKRLGGRRVPVTGRQRGDQPDIEHGAFAIEVKSRKALPLWLRDAVAQAVAARHDDIQLPIAILHQHGNRHSNDLVVMRLDDFEEWHGRAR